MTIPLEPEAVREYLDGAIRLQRWRRQGAETTLVVTTSKIHALQEVRVALLGERLAPEED